jgi:hypothetical protein
MQRRSALKLLSTGILASNVDLVEGQLFQIANTPATYRLQFLNTAQNEQVVALTETIIPADSHSGGAKEANVNLFVDVILANSDRTVQADWTKGLGLFDAEAQRRFGAPFARLDSGKQIEIMTFAAKNEAHPSTGIERFFVTLKAMTLNGYYTSPTGIHRDLQYIGNTALKNYNGCTHPEHQA